MQLNESHCDYTTGLPLVTTWKPPMFIMKRLCVTLKKKNWMSVSVSVSDCTFWIRPVVSPSSGSDCSYTNTCEVLMKPQAPTSSQLAACNSQIASTVVMVAPLPCLRKLKHWYQWARAGMLGHIHQPFSSISICELVWHFRLALIFWLFWTLAFFTILGNELKNVHKAANLYIYGGETSRWWTFCTRDIPHILSMQKQNLNRLDDE